MLSGTLAIPNFIKDFHGSIFLLLSVSQVNQGNTFTPLTLDSISREKDLWSFSLKWLGLGAFSIPSIEASVKPEWDSAFMSQLWVTNYLHAY